MAVEKSLTRPKLQLRCVYMYVYYPQSRLVLRGTGILCELEEIRKYSLSEICVHKVEELTHMRRYSVSDELISRLLHGVRMCL